MSAEVAVVGMAGRYPQAASLEVYWQRLVEGHSLARTLPSERAARGPVLAEDIPRWGAFIDDYDAFDAAFFGLDERAAAELAPDARVLFEVAWHALEDAGEARRGRANAGVFIGCGHDHYRDARIRAGHDPFIAGAQTALANKLSSFLDWRGPSLAVSTLCTSALTALHLALASLSTGECELALVGGVHVGIGPAYLAAAARLGILSRTGRARPFDANADGYVPGEGAGVLVLKPLELARRDRDAIWGVIKGTSVAHGGAESQGLALNFGACVASLGNALRRADVAPHTIGYVESLAVGNPLGDAIEVSALRRALASPSRTWPCAIGSVKPVVGHLEAAAGMAGIQRVLLSFRHGVIPATPVDSPNPALELDEQFFIATRARHWDEVPGPWRACVGASATFGLAAHVVLEAAPPPVAERPHTRGARLLTISACAPEALAELASRLEGATRTASVDAICQAMNAREPLAERLAIVLPTGSAGELEAFATGAGERAMQGRAAAPLRPVLVLGESDEVVMRAQLLATASPPFASELETTLAMLAPERAAGVRQVLATGLGDRRSALVIAQVAVARMWLANGLEPSSIVGHGVGEVSAAVVADVLELAPALELATTDVPGAREVPVRTPTRKLASDGALALAAGKIAEATRHIHTPDPIDARLRRLQARGARVALVVGASITSPVDGLRTIDCVLGPEGPHATMLAAAAALWVLGARLRWGASTTEDDRANKVSLPCYPFRRQRYWLEE